MLKYLDTKVTFAEVPDEVTLCINITGCKNNCKGCHSPYLAQDIGKPLNKSSLSELIEGNKGVSCVSFMGGDNDAIHLVALASWVKTHTNLKVAWYSGRQELAGIVARQLQWFDFIKLGPYKEEFGPLTDPNTNQRMYKISKGELIDITNRFWNESKS